MLALAVSSIVVLAFLTLFASGQKHLYNQKTRAMAVDDSRYPVQWLTRDINSAVQVEPELSFDGAKYTTSEDCLILKVPAVDGANRILNIDAYFDYIIYARDKKNPDRLWRMIRCDSRAISWGGGPMGPRSSMAGKSGGPSAVLSTRAPLTLKR